MKGKQESVINMNKQEAISKIYELKPDNKIIENYYSKELHSFEKGFANAKVMAALIVNKLDSLEKVLLPQNIADWIDVCKENLPLTLADAMNPNALRTNNQSEETIHWITSNQETFVKAWLYGYEVQKEKLYTVEIPNPNSAGGKLVLSKQQSTGKLILEMLNSDINKPKYLHLTEAEIKKDFAFLWQFAEVIE